MEKNIRLATSSNPNVAKGYRRTHLYATKLHNDIRFDLLALDELQYDADGSIQTDKDIRYRHRATGTAGRIEVKEWKVETQKKDWAKPNSKLRRQLDLMAQEYRRTGEVQVWANRRAAIPELRQYATQKGVLVFGHVVTGEKSAKLPGNVRFEELMDLLDRQHTVVARARFLTGGAQIGFGLLLAYRALPAAVEDLQLLRDPTTRSEATLLRFGERANLATSGVATTLSGGTSLATSFTTNTQALTRLTTISRASGGVAVVTFLAAEGFIVMQYAQGHLTNRQFASGQATLAGGVGGALGGAWVGGKVGAGVGATIGVWFFGAGAGPGATVGGAIGVVVGGVVGGFTGASVGDRRPKRTGGGGKSALKMVLP